MEPTRPAEPVSTETSGAAKDPGKKKFTPKKKKLIALLAVLLAAAILATVLIVHHKRNGGDDFGPMGLEVVTVDTQDLSESISVTGKVASRKVMAVTSDLSAKVKTLNVDLGDHVKKGDVLLTFDISDVEEEIKTLEKQLSNEQKLKAREKSRLQRAVDQAVADGNAAVKEAADEADKAYKVWAKLANDPEAEPDEVEEAESAYYAAEKAVNAAVKEGNAAVAAAQEAIEDAELDTGDDKDDSSKELAKLYRQRNNATVKADQDGIITQLNVSVGSTPEGTLMRIEDDKALAIQVGVKTKDIVRLEKGMRAEITTEAYPDETFGGTVTKVVNFTSSDTGIAGGDMGDSDSGDGYRADINIDDSEGLLLGMNVKVKILLKEGDEAMAVPYDSIVTEEDGAYVYRVVPTDEEPSEDGSMKGTVEKVKVVPGESSDYYTGVTSEDLAMGDYVVSFPEETSDGETVTFFVSDGMDFTEELEE